MARDDDNPYRIDPDRLDEEWLRQPRLTRAAGRQEADARHELSQAENALKLLAANIRKEVLSDPGAFGLPDKKPTKDDADAAVYADGRYQEQLTVIRDLERDVAYLKADTTALVDRRKALERLVELIALDYRAEREPQPLSADARERVRRAAARPAGRGGIDPDSD